MTLHAGVDLTERVDDRIKSATSVSRIGFEGYVSGDPEKEDPEVARRMAVGTHVCKEIRQAIMDELGYTCCGNVTPSRYRGSKNLIVWSRRRLFWQAFCEACRRTA